MSLPPTPKHHAVLAKYKRSHEELVNAKVKELLEQRHLYQSIIIDSDIAASELEGLSTDQARLVRAGASEYAESWWEVEPPTLPGGPPMRRITDRPDRPHLHVDSAKLFCTACDRREPYNLVYADDLYDSIRKVGVKTSSGRPEQMLVLAYLCQACKKRPETFLVFRYGRKITFVGRHPMEHVEVPSVIPKSQRRAYSDAVVAYQAGQILPALFMLRTVIEQHAVDTVGRREGERADQLVDRYMQALPEPVRAHFTSPREIYLRLSAAIHAASADAPLFERSTNEIVRHFDACRLYANGPIGAAL